MAAMQLSFGDAEHTGKRKKTRREVFLTEMEQVVPWNALLALIALDRPAFRRHPQAIIHGYSRGVHEQQAIHG